MLSTSLDENFLDLLEDGEETVLAVDQRISKIKDQLRREMDPCIDQVAEKLGPVWGEIGLSESTQQARVHDAANWCRQVFEDLIVSDTQSRESLKKYQDNRFKQINDMLEALHEPPYEAPTDLSLSSLCKILKQKFDELKTIKDQRVTQMTELLEQMHRLSDQMSETAAPFKTKTAIPSQEELCQLQSIVGKLQLERTKRLNRFRDLRQSILISAEELEYKPKNELERIVFDSEESKYVLSNQNITKLVKLHTELEKTIKKNEADKEMLIKRLEYLWDLLEVPTDERDDILSQYISKSNDCIARLKKEQVEKYEAERKKRLSEFIITIEPLVQDWWARCYISDKDIASFRETILDHPTGSEELLQAWEAELSRLKTYYTENEEIFTALENWHESLKDLEETELRANDPEIYKSRRLPSTFFMQMAKQKKALETKISKLETQLKACKSVNIEGRKLPEYIQSYRNNLDFLNKKGAEKGPKAAARPGNAAVSKTKGNRSNNSSVASNGNGKRNRLGTATPENSISPTKMARPLQRSGTITKMKAPGSASGSATKLYVRTPSQMSLGVRNIKRTPSVQSIDSEEGFKSNLNGRFDVNSTFKPSPGLRRRSKSSNDLAMTTTSMANMVLTPSKNINLRRPDYRRPFRP